jgi:hypothetical protein
MSSHDAVKDVWGNTLPSEREPILIRAPQVNAAGSWATRFHAMFQDASPWRFAVRWEWWAGSLPSISRSSWRPKKVAFALAAG